MDKRGARLQGRLAVLVSSQREAAGLTQRQLADRAGISLGALEDLEQGRTRNPRRQSLARLAVALELTSDQLGQLIAAAAAPTGQAAPAGPVPGPGPAGAGLRVAVLGPLTAWRDGLPLDLGSVRLRAVLGLLALHTGAGLPRAALMEALWGEKPPRTAVAMIHTQASRVRRLLGPAGTAGAARLAWDGAGYRLSLDSAELDLAEFGDLAAQAGRAAAAGHLPAACGLYRRALELWRGQVLDDVEVLRGHPAVTGLTRRRAEVVIEYASAAARAGLQDQVIADLEALASREPLDERAHAHLMLALAATGRQAAALRVHQDLAERLDAELGVQPGRELAAAHLQILRQQVPAPPGRGGTEPGRPVPRQLPPTVPRFAGRAAELAALTRMLPRAAEPGCTVVISAIGGTAGVGKTALAVHWAHQVAGRFPDGQLYVNLRGFGPAEPVTSEEALRTFLGALRVPAEQVPPAPAAQQGLYRSLLAGRRMLVVLGNARDPGQVRPLLPGVAGCMVLVTSRNQLTGLAAAEGAHLLSLDVLSGAEARLAGQAGGGPAIRWSL